MPTREDLKRYKQNWQAEQEAIYLYTKLAENETNPPIKDVFLKLAETEKKHAAIWGDKLSQAGALPQRFKPGFKTKFLAFLARRVGAGAVIPLVATIEKGAASEYAGQPEAEVPGMSKDEASHARIFNFMAKSGSGLEGSEVARFEGRHRTGGNALRAGVLGANDGLVSVFCLVMGVAGAGVDQKAILITGGAGLLAGALSMALGEWLSVQSSRELYQHQMKIEEQELEEAPEEELEELSLIYQAKGMDAATARKTAEHILADKATALDTLAREELAIDPRELGGSAWEAAITSFFLFAAGALFPVVPYFFFQGTAGIIASAVSSTVALLLLGLASSLMTGKSAVVSAIRQILIGWAAAGITFGIGHLIGVAL